MSKPTIWLYQLWLFTISITSSRNYRGLKPPRIQPHFHRVTQNMCNIYRMRNGCLCWLSLVTVDIIRDWLRKVTELPFMWVLNSVAVLHQVLCLHNNMARNYHLGSFFMIPRVNVYSEWIWYTGTLITYHMYLFWHDQVLRHRLRHMGR